jgi:aryl-alcohol dehydrogenase-like predicted oxidoreductase
VGGPDPLRDDDARRRPMEMRKVGNLEVSVAGLGCNNFGMRIDEDQTQVVVNAALDAGIT